MSQAAFARKLARINLGAGPAYAALGQTVPGWADPREAMIAEQDRRREYLAEELVKILAEEADPYHFTDTHGTKVQRPGTEDTYETKTASLTVAQWAEKLAHAALAAATVLYPEIPEPVNEGMVPNAAVEGAQSVAPDYRGMEAMQTAVYDHADPEGRQA